MTERTFPRQRLKKLRWTVAVVSVLGCLSSLGGHLGFAQGMASIDAILKTHHSWPTAPTSVEITGTFLKNGEKVPVKITATNLEEVVTEYGEIRSVSTSTKVFADDGKAVTYEKAPSGFAQLDVTGLFLLAQLQQRGVFVDGPVRIDSKDNPGYRIHVHSNRTQVHFGQSRVNDEFDVYVSESGTLTAISRLFYDEQPYRYTQTYKFSDFRETNSVFLPYRIEIYFKGLLTETIQVSGYMFDLPTMREMFQPRRSK